MQLVFSFRNVVVGTALVVAGYCAYRGFAADIESQDIGVLMRRHREASPARQLVIKRRILAVYQDDRDYERMVESLDGPSPVSQALAIEVLVAKGEHKAVPKLVETLDDRERADIVKERLAEAMARFRIREAIPRLIQLTDVSEQLAVRTAAHDALQALTGAGGAVKFSDAAREHWSLWWRDHHTSVRR